MPTEKSVDKFIEYASKLIASNPLVTLSTTYSNESKKILKKRAKKSSSSEEKEPFGLKNTAVITFKCFEPRSGQCIKYKTYKAKELSRLLAFVGPRGVSVTRKRSRDSDDTGDDLKRQKVETPQQVPGLSSLMSNVPYKEEEVQAPTTTEPAKASPTPEASQQEATSSKSKNKKKKKKGKK